MNEDARVLVIDDDEVALQAISDVLERAGYAVHSLASPIGATQIIATQGINVAVIDLNMPVMAGDRFVSLVRSWDRIRDLPIVLLSGESLERIRAAVAHLSGVTVLTKAQLHTLPSAVAAALRSAPRAAVEAPGLAADLRAARAQRLGAAALAPAAPESRRTPSSTQMAPVGDDSRRTASSAQFAGQARRMGDAWKEFCKGRSAQDSGLQQALTASQSQVRAAGLDNSGLLLASLLSLVEANDAAERISSEVDATVREFFEQLNGGAEQLRSWDRSLAPTMLRSRIERARQAAR